jgi:hypothetical protein
VWHKITARNSYVQPAICERAPSGIWTADFMCVSVSAFASAAMPLCLRTCNRQLEKELMPSLDLTLSEATILPEELAGGTWPADYTLSDHGMVTCLYQLRERSSRGDV